MKTRQNIAAGILIFLISLLTFQEMRAQTMAYGYIISSPLLPEGPCRFIPENPDSIISLAPTTSPDPIVANTWGNGTWWAAEAYDPANGLNHGHLYTIDTLTGLMTDIGPLNQNLDALAYNHWSDSLFGLKSLPDNQGKIWTYIYSINTSSGNAQLSDTLEFEGNIGGFAYNYNTNRYFIGTNSKRYYSCPETDYSEPDLEFSLTAAISSPGDMACNLNNNTKYILSDQEGGELVSVDASKIHGHLLGNLPAGTRLSGLAIPYTYTHPTGEDVGIVGILYPLSGCQTHGEPVIVLLKNFGTQTIDDFDMNFSCYNDSNQVIQDEIMVSFSSLSFGYQLHPGDEFPFTFWPVVDVNSPGEYSIFSWITNPPPSSLMHPHHAGYAYKYFRQFCFPLSCPDSSISESEICGNMGNDGCEMAEASFDTIVPGNTICGDTWHVEEMGDRDWFYFEPDSVCHVKFTVKASTRLDIAVKTLPCENSSLIAAKTIEANTSDSLEMNLLPGKYAFIVNINTGFYNVICGNPNNYYFHFETSPAYTCTVATDTLSQDSLYISALTVGNNAWNNAPAPDGYTQAGNLSEALYGALQQDFRLTTANSLPQDQAAIWIDLNHNLSFEASEQRVLLYDPVLQQWALPNPWFTIPETGWYSARARVSRTGIPEPCGVQPGTDAVDFRVFTFVDTAQLNFQLIKDCAGESVVRVNLSHAREVTQLNFTIGFSNPGISPTLDSVNPLLGTNYQVFADTSHISFLWIGNQPVNLDQTRLFDIRFSPDWQQQSLQNDITVQNILAGNQFLYPCNCAAMLSFQPDACALARVSLCYADTGGNIIQGNNYVYFTGITPPFFQTTGYNSGVNPVGSYLANGTYALTATTDHPWGGVNATDALLILKHFTGMSVLSGLPLQAADVNADQYVNSVDALMVMKRFTGMISAFAAGDWLFEPKAVNVNSLNSAIIKLRGICLGDVNASYGL